MNEATQPKSKRTGYARDPHDFFIEPAWCVGLLFEHVRFHPVLWDPCCGIGTIPTQALKYQFEPYASDLIDRGHEPMWKTADFLTLTEGPEGGTADIVMNPPYGRAKLAVKFIDHALKLTGARVAAIVTESFLFSAGKWNGREFVGGRHDKFTREWPLKHILFLSSRPSMPPGGMEIPATGGQTNYVWLVFERGFEGHAIPDWLRRTF